MRYYEDTGEVPSVTKHIDSDDISTLEGLIEFFVTMCKGNGRIGLIISNGKVQDYEPGSRIPKKRREKKAG